MDNGKRRRRLVRHRVAADVFEPSVRKGITMSQQNTTRSTALQPLNNSSLETITGGQGTVGGQPITIPDTASKLSMPDIRFSMPDLRFYSGWPGEIG